MLLCFLGSIFLVIEICQGTMVFHPLRPLVECAVTYITERVSR